MDLATIQGLLGQLGLLSGGVAIIVEVLKRLPNKYVIFPKVNPQTGKTEYGITAAIIISIIAVFLYAHFKGILNMANIELLSGLTVIVIPTSMGIYDVIKKAYKSIKVHKGEKVIKK